jgi:putative sigma-54 modulation protein
MKVNVQAVNFNVDKKLLDFIQERMDKLEKYYDKIVSSDVF